MKWDECNNISELFPRALQLHVNDRILVMEDDAECSGSSSESDTTENEIEQSDSGEEAHQAQENAETSLLRPNNTNWMLTEGIQVDHFQGPKTILSLTWDFGIPVVQRKPRLTTLCHVFHAAGY